MNLVIRKEELFRIVVLDSILVSLVLIMPAVVHALGVSARFIEPMRLSLFASAFMVSDKRNSYLLAATLPLISMCVIGMPIWYKAVLMSVELSANIFIYYSLCGRRINPFVAVLTSIIASKAIYYFLKYILIQFAVFPQGTLISNVVPQIIVALSIATIFYIGSKVIKR